MKEQTFLESLAEPLLKWYGKNGRPLPWRKSPDAYRVWISEIMLQQTRIEAVLGYYERFLERLPDVQSLAAVSDEELMKLWEGLGYYSRARNLKKAARIICESFSGVFPESFEDMLSLPGIGEYTAGAIASIAFGQPRAAVDGNVMRLISRITESDIPVNDPRWKKELSKALSAVSPIGQCGAFTQALMELGETVCIPNGTPLCGSCPLSALCSAHKNGTWGKFPVPAPKKARRRESYTLLLLRCGERIAVRRRGEGLLGGMWEFPNIPGKLTREQVFAFLEERGLQPGEPIPAASGEHIFTHVEWEMTSWLVCCGRAAEYHWIKEEDLDALALPTAFRKFRSSLASGT